MMHIILTPDELRAAEDIGVRRSDESLSQDAIGHHVFGYGYTKEELEEENETLHINIAGAELAAAKAFGVEWNKTAKIKDKPDPCFSANGKNYYVRWRRLFDSDLLVRVREPSDCEYILATGARGDYAVVGQCSGAAAKQQEFSKGNIKHPWGYIVPKRRLLPMNGVTVFWPDTRIVSFGEEDTPCLSCSEPLRWVVVRQRKGVETKLCANCDAFLEFVKWETSEL